MSALNMESLSRKLQDLESSLSMSKSPELCYSLALTHAITCTDLDIETEALKSLGDVHLEKAKLTRCRLNVDKAAALYAAALLRCTDPNMRQTIEHRIGYLEKLSCKLLQGYAPQLPSDNKDYAENHVLRVAEICLDLERKTWNNNLHSLVETYAQSQVEAIAGGDSLLEVEILKSLGDLYLRQGQAIPDVLYFTKALPLYKKALWLTVCEDPDMKQTLLHRVKYAEKIRKTVIKRLSKASTSTPEHRCWQSADRRCTEIMRADTTQDQHSQVLSSQYKDHITKGNSSLESADLDSAEKHFAAALKLVHVKTPDVLQSQREVVPLYKLGNVYSKCGQVTRDGSDFVKASALYNAAIARSQDKEFNVILRDIVEETEQLFVKHVLSVGYSIKRQGKEDHKKKLKKMRDQIKLEMETIDQQLNPYIHEEDDPCVRDIEAKRSQAVRQLFDKIADERKDFITHLTEECIMLIGTPPCMFALIGLGSQSTGLVTPYSDLEFAILIEKEDRENVAYFRQLTHYLHLKVVNLGETILPAMGIKCLNDFYSKDPLDNWFYDSVTPRGFAFDGSMPKASKTPLGLLGTATKPSSELIRTPNNMTTLLQNDAIFYLKEGYHLANILRNPCLLVGEQALVDKYMSCVRECLKAEGGKMALRLAEETLGENIVDYDKHELTSRLIDVKKEVYRFPAISVDCFALCSNVIPTTVWNTIEELESRQVISAENAHHLKVLVSISAELRLRTYIANGGQKESLSPLLSLQTSHGTEDKTQRLQKVFHITNNEQLFRYYYTAIPFKKFVTLECFKEQFPGVIPPNLFSVVLFDNSPEVKADMCLQLCDYNKAVGHYQKALTSKRDAHGENKAHPSIAGLLNSIGTALQGSGNHREAVSYHEQALIMRQSIYGQSQPHPDIANSLNNLATDWEYLGNHRKAVSYYEQALQMFRSIHEQSKPHPDTANALNNLGATWHHLGEHRKAVSYSEQALQMRQSVYGVHTAHPAIAISLTNLGAAFHSLGGHKEAINYQEKALLMWKGIYGPNTVHPHIAFSLSNLGETLRHLGEYERAFKYHEQALLIFRNIYGLNAVHPHRAACLNNMGECCYSLGDHRNAIRFHELALHMRKTIYGQSTAHPDIAQSLNNIGGALANLGNYQKAVCYHEQALKMWKTIYGQRAHPNIACSLNNLGGGWGNLGDFQKALDYHTQSLEMRKTIYGLGTAHPETAESLNNLGGAWAKLRNYKKAFDSYEHALQMRKTIYGPNAPHPSIARTLNNIGMACVSLGDLKKAISYHEQALQMRRHIYGQTTTHPDIATSLNNLGLAWYALGDHVQAITYYEQALQMLRTIFGPRTAHPNIATLLSNLAEVFHKLGDKKRAVVLYQESLAMMTLLYPQGRRHPKIQEMERNIECINMETRQANSYKKSK